MSRSLTPQFLIALGLSAGLTLGCATQRLDTRADVAHQTIPAVDPEPEFERDPVEDSSHSITDVELTVARINPEFAAMMRDAGVTADLATRSNELHTVFVPSPDVFKPNLLQGDAAEKRRLLSYYVVPGRMTSSELTNLMKTPTITGQPLEILVDERATFFAVNQARVLKPNIEARDGIVHQIDNMLLPPDHPAAPGLRDESPTAYVRVDVTLANTCEMRQPRAFFAFDSATLRATAHDSLEELAMCLTTGSLAGQRLLLEGYTDPRGGEDYNKTLGRERASAVESYLVSKGMPASQVKVVSHGERHAHDEQPMFWDLDRRVDISLAADLKR